MSYLTDFNTIVINETLSGNGNITITGNISSDTSNVTVSQTIGNLNIDSSNSAYGVVISTPTGQALRFQQSNISVETQLAFDDLNNFKLPGGNASTSYFLTTNGSGNLSWAIPQGQGNGVVGGSINSIQFNNGNGFGGDASKLAYDSVADRFTVGTEMVIAANAGSINASNAQISVAAPNLYITGGTPGQVLYSEVDGNTRWGNLPIDPPGGPQGALQFNDSNTYNGSANLVLTEANGVAKLQVGQSYIEANVTRGALEISVDNSDPGNVTITSNPLGNGASSNIVLLPYLTSAFIMPTVSRVKMPGGSNNYVLQTDGSSNLSYAPRNKLIVTDIANTTYTIPNIVATSLFTVSNANAVTITLPLANVNTIGGFINIKDIVGGDRANNSITINASGSDTIDGTTSATIIGNYNSVVIAQVTANSWGVI